MKHLRTSLSAALAASAFSTVLVATGVKATEWTCYTYIPSAQHAVVQALTKIGEDIETITNGEVEVTCHPGGSLSISAADITAATSDDVIQLASNAFITGSVPIVGIFSLPGLFTTEEELSKGIKLAEPYIAEAMAAQDLTYLGAYNYPRQVIFSTQPISRLEDLSGRKFRVASGEQAEFVTRFGGTPVTIGTPDVAQALQLGTISGVLTAASGGAPLWTDYLTDNYEVGPNFTVSPIFANTGAFEALSVKQQEQVRAAVKAEAKVATDNMRERNAENVEKFAAGGMNIHKSNPEDETLLVEKSKNYWDTWAADRGEDAQALLKEVRDGLGK